MDVRVNKVAIIGGGSAGMMAAIAAARHGADVTILERMHRLGKKLLVTGNGRCNLTNFNMEPSRFHGQHPEFVMPALRTRGVRQTIAFFESLGISHIVEDEGKVFPRSGQASSVLDVLRFEIEKLGIKVLCDARVSGVRPTGKGFRIIFGEHKEIAADRVLLAAGGKACPDLGSNGSGYKLAESLGHKVCAPFPALTRLSLKASFLKRLKGLKFNGEAAVGDKKVIYRKEAGEILFTEKGVSGPPILQLSRAIGENLQKNRRVWISLDLIPDIHEKNLFGMLEERFREQGHKKLESGLVGFLNKRLIPVVLKEAGLENTDRTCKELTDEQIRRLSVVLKKWVIEVTGTGTWMEAQVTAGGVDVSEVSPANMESRMVNGLYFAGEILDIDGECGGFNLEWAWSSGYIAGACAAGYKDGSGKKRMNSQDAGSC